VFGRYAKMDPSALSQYANALPHLYAAMNGLTASSGDPVIVTTGLKNSALAIINNHRDVPDARLQVILNRLESDVQFYEGMTKQQVLASLTPMTIEASVPALSRWGLICLVLLLMTTGAILVRRRMI